MSGFCKEYLLQLICARIMFMLDLCFGFVKNSCCHWSVPELCVSLVCVWSLSRILVGSSGLCTNYVYRWFVTGLCQEYVSLVCVRVMFITGLWPVFVQNTRLMTVSVLCYSWFTREVRVSQKSVLCSFWFLHEVRVILISVLCYRWFNRQVLVWPIPILC